ncbi:MAG: DMT family transporter [Burkholderiaceae bacterium]
MLLASLLFAAMGVCVKFAAAYFNSAELIFWRGLIGVLFIWAIARVRGIPLATPHFAMHAWRSLVGVFALGTWFYALAHLPLATAMTLNYMSSIWIAMFLVGGALITWRPVRPGGAAPGAVSPPSGQGPLVLSVLAGFVGVVLLLRPSVGAGQSFAASIGLLSGLAAAFAYMQVMALAKVGEPEARTVFYFAAGSGAVGAVAMLWTGISPWTWEGAVWLLPIGLLASLGQLCMTRAYSYGATLVVANLQYAGIVFGAIFGVWLFGDTIRPLGWAGMALIIASGVAATALRERAAPAPITASQANAPRAPD